MNKLFLCYRVLPCSRAEVKNFIEKWHYSHNINGVISDFCFKMEWNGKIIGAVIFGRLAMANQWKKYTDNAYKIIELRRLVCQDNTFKNAESYMIGRCVKWLRDNTNTELIISYADPEYGHSGIIYKASNFQLVGHTSKGKVIIWNNKKYHDKCIRTKYNGSLKPFAQRVKTALEKGEAFYKPTQGKSIFLYKIKRKSKDHFPAVTKKG